MRYKLRSSTKTDTASMAVEPPNQPSGKSSTSSPSTSKMSSEDHCQPPEKKARMSVCRRKVIHKAICSKSEDLKENQIVSSTNILNLGVDVILHLAKYLDGSSLISLYRSCHYFYDMLRHSGTFWKFVCTREELANYECLSDKENETLEDLNKVGWSGKTMRIKPPDDYDHWRKVYLRGLQMRRNIIGSNFEGWRIYANTQKPVAKLTPDLDLNDVKKEMGEFAKLSVNDDLKIDWDDKKLVVFHFFRSEGESCTIRVWDIEHEPRFDYAVEKGIECITDKVFVHDGHVVIVPSWPLSARAVVMTLSIENQMSEVGKFLFRDADIQSAIDDNWEHTQLRVVKDKAMVVCR